MEEIIILKDQWCDKYDTNDSQYIEGKAYKQGSNYINESVKNAMPFVNGQ